MNISKEMIILLMIVPAFFMFLREYNDRKEGNHERQDFWGITKSWA